MNATKESLAIIKVLAMKWEDKPDSHRITLCSLFSLPDL